MEVLLGVGIALLGLLGIVSSRWVTTFMHETGHALAALVLTRQRVEMFVGSYGEEKSSIILQIGRLKLFLSFIIWDLEIGLCRLRGQTTIAKSLVITLCGPLLSLIVGGLLLYGLTLSNFTDTQKFIMAVFMVASVWDFFVNIIPRQTETKLADGSTALNDGQQLINLYQLSSESDDYFASLDLVAEGRLPEALAKIDELIKETPKNRRYHESKQDILAITKDYHGIIKAFEGYLSMGDPRRRYLSLWAAAKMKLHDYDEVVKTLTNVIYAGKGDYDLHFLRGKALCELGEYMDAMRDFHALTLGEYEDPRALANRAYCQFRLGYKAEAMEDALQAVDQAKDHKGEINYLAGVIMEDSDEEMALKLYKNAVALHYEHHALSFNISRLEKYTSNE